jgi:hypothetical protein
MSETSSGRGVRGLFALIVLTLLGGCATSYVVPGPRADLQAFGGGSIQESFAAQATAPFPATLAFVRVQAPTYASARLPETQSGAAAGRFRVITTREAEDDAQVERLGRLPQVTGVTTLSRLLLPPAVQGDKDLREAAARLHADLLLVYTFDTAIFDTDLARPLTVITLGLSPTRKLAISTTASALLMDTRTGYVYSTYEATKKADTLATSWNTADSADQVRRDNEREAFGLLLGQVEKTWPRLIEQHARKS